MHQPLCIFVSFIYRQNAIFHVLMYVILFQSFFHLIRIKPCIWVCLICFHVQILDLVVSADYFSWHLMYVLFSSNSCYFTLPFRYIYRLISSMSQSHSLLASLIPVLRRHAFIQVLPSSCRGYSIILPFVWCYSQPLCASHCQRSHWTPIRGWDWLQWICLLLLHQRCT